MVGKLYLNKAVKRDWEISSLGCNRICSKGTGEIKRKKKTALIDEHCRLQGAIIWGKKVYKLGSVTEENVFRTQPEEEKKKLHGAQRAWRGTSHPL